jgi:hypothetical protein
VLQKQIFRAFAGLSLLLPLLASCARPPEPPVTAETSLPPGKAIVVHGFVCSAFSETHCTIEFGRVIGDNFSETESQRIYAAARPENLMRFAGMGLPSAPNKDKKMGYYAHVVEPGTYGLKQFSTSGDNRTTNYLTVDKETKRPFAQIEVEAGKINYLGDFLFRTSAPKGEPRIIRFEDRTAAEAYLATFPKLTGEWVMKPVKMEP